MSYILSLFKLPAHITSINELSQDAEVEPLGSKAAILALLADLFPDADFSDPTWVILNREEFAIEFIVGHEDPVASLGLRIHGADRALAVAQLLCEQMGWRAFDPSFGELIDFGCDPEAGLRAWRAYSHRALDHDHPSTHHSP
jgi:hypothetical protein